MQQDIHGTIFYCTAASETYEHQLICVFDDIRSRIRSLPKSKAADDGLLGAIFALRVLASNAPADARTYMAKGEVESWKDQFVAWFERVKSKFPKKVDRNAVLNVAMQEFAQLIDLGVDVPKSIWQSDAVKALRILDERDSH